MSENYSSVLQDYVLHRLCKIFPNTPLNFGQAAPSDYGDVIQALKVLEPHTWLSIAKCGGELERISDAINILTEERAVQLLPAYLYYATVAEDADTVLYSIVTHLKSPKNISRLSKEEKVVTLVVIIAILDKFEFNQLGKEAIKIADALTQSI